MATDQSLDEFPAAKRMRLEDQPEQPRLGEFMLTLSVPVLGLVFGLRL